MHKQTCCFHYLKSVQETVVTHRDGINKKTRFYNLKINKEEQMINNYNPQIRRIFDADMDKW